ncbi:A-kinase anchor protein 10, mitochondrial [Parasteatoda tepidariorum]|nr:A-kinase anchor protein 10, mitochondrial [Parasteatoda tepidariorum]
MSFFRRKKNRADSVLPRTSSISVYGQGRSQSLHSAKNSDKTSDSGSFSSIDLEDRPHPLAFAEATYEDSLPMKTKSRLSKDLEEVLNDNAALAYFIQFMDAKAAKHLIKFWLEAESFKVSLETKRKTLKQPVPQIPCDPNVCAANSSGSGSSGYTSDKSEEVFHLSSQTKNSLTSTYHKQNGLSIGANSGDANVNKNVSLGVRENVCDNSIKYKSVTQHLSVDSGCEVKCKEHFSSSEISCVDFIDDNKPDVNNIETLCESCVQETDVMNKEQSSDVLKEGLVKLETSVEQDAISIFSKFIDLDAPSPIDVSNDLREAIKNNILSTEIDTECFVPAQRFVVKKMAKEFYPIFLRSSFHCKHQIDVLTSGNVYLADVLYNDSALFFFMEFMEQEGVRHLVDFLLMADNFQKHLRSQKEGYDGMQAQTDAMVIYDKYFSLQATIPLGFSDAIRFEVEMNICGEEGPNPDCFLKPVKILTQYLEKTYLLQFLNSQLYFKYISECIIIIQNDGTDNLPRQKYTGSDSGSEQSLPISSVNTLLAMDSKQLGTTKVIKNIDDQDMRIDTQQFRPDTLWQRPLAGKLQMAHVDHLGRVTTEFEPEPDRKKESKISKAVKKLVNWEEDKNQEDMAWKVAEMIVKDICSVTMPTEFNNCPTQDDPS